MARGGEGGRPGAGTGGAGPGMALGWHIWGCPRGVPGCPKGGSRVAQGWPQLEDVSGTPGKRVAHPEEAWGGQRDDTGGTHKGLGGGGGRGVTPTGGTGMAPAGGGAHLGGGGQRRGTPWGGVSAGTAPPGADPRRAPPPPGPPHRGRLPRPPPRRARWGRDRSAPPPGKGGQHRDPAGSIGSIGSTRTRRAETAALGRAGPGSCAGPAAPRRTAGRG